METNSNPYRIERRPAGDELKTEWAIRRAPADKPLKVISLCSDFFCVRTHFFHGRTTPCRKENCEACASCGQSRWSGYLLAIDIADGVPIVFEFTPPGITVLDKAVKEFGSARGLQIVASRPTKRANGKVVLSVKGVSPTTHKLPVEVELWPVLAKIWGVNLDFVPNQTTLELNALSENERVLLCTKATHLAIDAKPVDADREGKKGGRRQSLNGVHKP